MSGKATILHVEDDRNDVVLVKQAFGAANSSFDLKAASDGEAAVAYLSGAGEFADRERFPFPVAVLLDLKMPRRGGFEVLEWLEAHPKFRRLPVIIFTSSKQREDIDRAYDLCAHGYVVKPVGFDKLVEIAQVMSRWLSLNEQPAL
jgi:CheY-like chemotaxis protein